MRRSNVLRAHEYHVAHGTPRSKISRGQAVSLALGAKCVVCYKTTSHTNPSFWGTSVFSNRMKGIRKSAISSRGYITL